MYSIPGFAVFTFIACISLCRCHPPDPPPVIVDTGRYISSISSSSSSGSGYRVNFAEAEIDGICISTMTIFGKGIYKRVDYDCNSKPRDVISLNSALLVGDEYFANTHGELVHLTPDGCKKEIFTRDKGKFISTVVPMVEEECKKVKDKIVIMKEQQHRWNLWYTQQQQQLQQQLQQLQNNLANLQQNIFGNLFGGFFG